MRGEVLGLPLAGRRLQAIAVRLDVFDDVLVEPLTPGGAVVARDTGVLLRLAAFDVLKGDATFLGSYQQLAADVFWAYLRV